MRKIIFTMTISMIAGLVFAQAPVAQTPVEQTPVIMVQEQPPDVSVSADVGVYSAYVWRGLVLNGNMVAQPSVTAAYGPFSLNVWGNFDLIDPSHNNTEVDYTAAYTLPLNTEAVAVDVGFIYYTFPGGNDTDATEEIFVKTTFNNIILTPVASLYYDIDEVNGWYGNLAVSQSVEISDAMTAKIGGSIGCGTRNYNSYMFGEHKNAVNDYNIYVSAEYALTEKLSVGALLQYTRLDSEVANEIYDSDALIWGGINLSYKFL